MKKFIFIAILFLCTTTHSQIVKDANGNYHQLKGTADTTATGKTFTDAKGSLYPVYKSSTGKLFVLRTSKAGNVYKQYLKD